MQARKALVRRHELRPAPGSSQPIRDSCRLIPAGAGCRGPCAAALRRAAHKELTLQSPATSTTIASPEATQAPEPGASSASGSPLDAPLATHTSMMQRCLSE